MGKDACTLCRTSSALALVYLLASVVRSSVASEAGQSLRDGLVKASENMKPATLGKEFVESSFASKLSWAAVVVAFGVSVYCVRPAKPCADVSLLCVQRQTKTIHRRLTAARGGLRKTLRQKTACSNENPGGILGDRDRNNELTRWRTL